VKIRVVGPKSWTPLVVSQAKNVSTEAACLGWALLRAAHSSGRAAGLTLTYALATSLTKREPQGSPPWDAFWKLVVDDVNGPPTGLRAREEAEARLLRLWRLCVQKPWLASQALLEPISDTIQQELGEAYFFGGNGFEEPDGFKRAYQDYDLRFAAKASELMSNVTAHARHWRQLFGFAAEHSAATTALELPQIDGISGRLYLDAGAIDLADALAGARSQQPTPISVQRGGLRPQQDGVVGLRKTRSIDEIGSVLPSEFAQPEILFLDRLLHEGLNIVDRPPHTRRQRKIMFAAVAFEAVDDAALSAIQASWWVAFDAAACALFRAHFVEIGGAWVATSDAQISYSAAVVLHRDEEEDFSTLPAPQRRLRLLEAFAHPSQPLGQMRRSVNVSDDAEFETAATSRREDWLQSFDEDAAQTMLGHVDTATSALNAEASLDVYDDCYLLVICPLNGIEVTDEVTDEATDMPTPAEAGEADLSTRIRDLVRWNAPNIRRVDLAVPARRGDRRSVTLHSPTSGRSVAVDFSTNWRDLRTARDELAKHWFQAGAELISREH